jgi:hypothetical protein
MRPAKALCLAWWTLFLVYWVANVGNSQESSIHGIDAGFDCELLLITVWVSLLVKSPMAVLASVQHILCFFLTEVAAFVD